MKRIFRPWLSILIIVVIIGYITFTMLRQLPLVQPEATPITAETTSSLVWPTAGESAVGIVGSKTLNTYGTQVPKPTASTAKLITALMVLKAKPLRVNQTGPTVTLTQNDVNTYNAYVAEQGSVVPVQVGEQITEYQMLEAMLLPSANNIADSMATWAYGSLPAYSTAANSYVKSLGLTSTTIGSDASGFLPTTVSTAQDLVTIGELVMQNPVLAGIVDESSATIPVAGTVYNVDTLLGKDNIVGIKTGNTDQAGGVFVGAVRFNLGNDAKTIVTANVGASDLNNALIGSQTLLKSVQSNFHNTVIVKSHQTVATYKAPWSTKSVTAVTNNSIAANVWGGNSFKLSLNGLEPISYKTSSNSSIGQVSDKALDSTSTDTSLSQNIPDPSILWRISHP